MNCLSVSKVFLHLRALSWLRGWRGTGGRGELTLARTWGWQRHRGCVWSLAWGMAWSGPQPRVAFVRESCHPGRAAVGPWHLAQRPRALGTVVGPWHLRQHPGLWGTICSGSLPLSRSQAGYMRSARPRAAVPWLLSGSPYTLSTVPLAWQQCQRGRSSAGRPGRGSSPAVLLFPPRAEPLAAVTRGSAGSGSSPWEEGSWCWHGRRSDVAGGR